MNNSNHSSPGVFYAIKLACFRNQKLIALIAIISISIFEGCKKDEINTNADATEIADAKIIRPQLLLQQYLQKQKHC